MLIALPLTLEILQKELAWNTCGNTVSNMSLPRAVGIWHYARMPMETLPIPCSITEQFSGSAQQSKKLQLKKQSLSTHLHLVLANIEHSNQLLQIIGLNLWNHALWMLIAMEKIKSAPSYFGKPRMMVERPSPMDQLVMTGNHLHAQILTHLLQKIQTSLQPTNSVSTTSTGALRPIPKKIQQWRLVFH